MSWQVTTEPASEPVTLADAKAHLREDSSAQDSTVEALITAARQHAEVTCNRAIMPQTWTGTFPSFHAVRLAGGKVQSIDSITYIDPDGSEQTLTSSDYRQVLAEPARIAPADSWPDIADRIDAVEIVISVGYADADSVPQAIKQAMLLDIELNFDRPEESYAANLRKTRDALLFPYRIMYP